MGAIEAQGSLRTCLKDLQDELAFKQDFVKSLIENLHSKDDHRSDHLTTLHSEGKQLFQTLSVRLSLLSPDRESAWFRKSALKTAGPFTSTIFSDPVFFPYDKSSAEKVKAHLSNSYKGFKQASPKIWSKESELDFSRGEHCLWTRLLMFNEQFRSRSVIKVNLPSFEKSLKSPLLLDIEHFGEMSPLPYYLDSRPLRAFLLNVQSELRNIKTLINQCYETLFHTSQILWDKQLSEKPHHEEKSNRAHASTSPPWLSHLEKTSLEFMGFTTLPNPQELRRKYLELAKKLHPDVHQGQDGPFKTLTECYEVLQKKVHRALY